MDRVAKLETLTRIGFAARGIMYLLIGWLALRLGRAEGSSGALEYISSGGGRILLWLMALGFVAYGIWRLAEAALDTEGHGKDTKGLAARIGGAVSGVIHLSLALYAMRLASGGPQDGGSGGAESGARTAMQLPGGQTLLTIAAVILIGVGLYQFVKAAKAGFLKRLAAEAAHKDWVKWVGRAGYAARGAVFLVMGVLLWQAARSGNAAAAGGPDEALASFSGWPQALVAAGLFLFGVFSLVEARWRKINDPQVASRLRDAAGRARA